MCNFTRSHLPGHSFDVIPTRVQVRTFSMNIIDREFFNISLYVRKAVSSQGLLSIYSRVFFCSLVL